MTLLELARGLMILVLLIMGINHMVNKVLDSFSSSYVKKEEENSKNSRNVDKR